MYKLNKLGLPIFFIPLLLISGPLLTDLTVTLSAIIFLIFVVINKNIIILITNILFFLCFWIFISANSFASENLSSIKSSLTYLRFGIFFVLLSYIFNSNDNFSENFKKVILFYIDFVCRLFNTIYFWIQYHRSPKSGRISSFFGDEKIMGVILSSLYQFI